MTPTIIIDFHETRRGRDAVALARTLGDLTGARYVTVTSYLRDRYGLLPIQGSRSATPEETKEVADQAKSLLGDEPGAVARVFGASSPARALHEVAEREQADLIVVGSSAHAEDGQADAGASGRQVLQGAPCAVAVAPAGHGEAAARLVPIGLGFDGSPESRVALSSAAGLANSLGGELRVISVLARPAPGHPMFAFTSYHEHLEQLHAECRSRLVEVLEGLPVQPEMEPLVVEGEPTAVLTAHAAELGLLVVGSRGYGPLRQVLLGGVTRALLDGVACPVMIVPRGVQRAFGASILHTRPAHSH
jgi:nucleotide-binding universal stress UspA family protein